jgi:hypothetical protein
MLKFFVMKIRINSHLSHGIEGMTEQRSAGTQTAAAMKKIPGIGHVVQQRMCSDTDDKG